MEALEPGASVSAIARRIGIHPSQLFAWRSRCSGRAALSLAALELRGCGGVCDRRSDRNCYCEVIVRAGADVDETQLQRVIRAVRSA
ncbi:transposase [Bradyrhizobium acaciae]|uniref:transposase n=1 Tax=Bradyrhizobium acaciae TaxID=2683706 RepID=UPI001E28780C|nr:transposase [Bradyrhizobium acaciae]